MFSVILHKLYKAVQVNLTSPAIKDNQGLHFALRKQKVDFFL